MWSIIHENDIERAIIQYPVIQEYFQDIVLYYQPPYYFVPRTMYATYRSKFIHRYIDDEWSVQHISDDYNMDPQFKLRSEQESIIEKTKYHLETSRKGGIVQARPGTGKTVMAVYLSMVLKLKTLIVIDSTNLLEQWKEAIVNFTNIPEDQIGLIKGTKFPKEDYPFTIAMVQTMCSQVKKDMQSYYNQYKDEGYGIVYFDECHKSTCGPQYAKASLLLNTPLVIGLSATPFVYKLQEVLLHNTIGQVITIYNDYDHTPQIYFAKYSSGMSDKYKYIMSCADLFQKRARYNQQLIKSHAHFYHVGHMTNKLYEQGHNVIILTATNKHIDAISKYLTSMNLKNRPYNGTKRKIDKDNDRIIVTNNKFSGAGFDMKRLSALIIATPLSGKKSLIQVIGRIVRTCEGKLQPVVIDMIDTDIPELFEQTISYKRSFLEKEFRTLPSTVNVLDLE